MSGSTIGLIVYAVVYAAILARVLVVEGKEPVSRAAWILILLFVPIVGIGAYVLFGEPWVPRRFRRKASAAAGELAEHHSLSKDSTLLAVPERFRPAFRTCERLAHSDVTNGNRGMLASSSDAAIDAMVEDFDAARETIHVSFYIWLTDHNGIKVVEALKRAAERGVTCRVIADDVGSRGLIRSRHWAALEASGVRVCASMKLSMGLGVIVGSRVDIRNHRKIVVVDNCITWCGSQNCADPEFRVKPRYAPWVDIMLRFTGPVARQNQRLFAADWMVEADEDLSAHWKAMLPDSDAAASDDLLPAIAFGTGPLSPIGAMSDVFVSLLGCAQSEVVISNPYFVPDPPLLAALIACAARGVSTTLILPARNDSWVVGVISRAYYPQLAEAGVQLFEYRPGLLHAKTLLVDGQVALVGSANMDRRSLELNFENNILLCSVAMAETIRQRQNQWLADSSEVSSHAVAHRSLPRRMGDNLVAMFGPVV